MKITDSQSQVLAALHALTISSPRASTQMISDYTENYCSELPRLQQLENKGLVGCEEIGRGRHKTLYWSLTDAGREAVSE